MTNKIQNSNPIISSQGLAPRYCLYLDTSELSATIAVFAGSEKLAEETWEAGRELSNSLSKKYQEVLSIADIESTDLSGICVFVGPGSFTGLRIGLSFGNGLAFALGIPIYETREKGVLNVEEPKETALPFYGAEPKITEPKKK
jgi:tRNA threonylcarbamoyladenosine biosynthesis protein TsaB